jgi:Divergent InlB B-repeat domain
VLVAKRIDGHRADDRNVDYDWRLESRRFFSNEQLHVGVDCGGIVVLDHDLVRAAGFGRGRRDAEYQRAQRALTGSTLTGTAVTTVTKFTFSTSVAGPGTITQSPTGTSFANNATVNLRAVPNPGATFSNWGRAGATTNLTTCSVIGMANEMVSATSTAPQCTLATSMNGPGTITQSPTGTSFASGTAITLTAVPITGATFTSWSGGVCSGSTNPVCTFILNANTAVTAWFLNVYSRTTSVVDPGSITQSPTGASLNSGTPVTLTAVPGANATFTSWSGACAAAPIPSAR